MAELHTLLSQAMGRRGTHIQTSWHSGGSQFSLDVISNTGGGDPKWRLVRDDRGTRQLLFDYPSCDVLLVNNFIASSCAAVQANSQAAAKAKPVVVPEAPPSSVKVDQAVSEAQAAVPHSGEVSKYPLDQLLKSIKNAQMTGKLEVRNGGATALLYVQDGVPFDATTSESEGEDAIIEFLTWTTGQFAFEPRVLRNSHTVHQPIDSLVAQSKQLSERLAYLRGAGIQHTSSLMPKTNLTDGEFDQRAARGAPANVEDIRKFYRSLDGSKTMDEILRSMYFPRVQLINVLYHLVINDLVRISSAIVTEKVEQLHPRAIDSVAIQGVMMNLRRLETGMFIYPAFLYFLEQEYFRCHRSNTPLSVIVFEIRVLGAGAVLEMLPAPAVLDAVLRISQLKRHVDLIAHYDQFDYALLLPNTKSNGAQIFAKRIVKALTDTPLAGNVDASKLCISLGCASMPEDFSELSELLGAADLAMAKSRTTQKQVVMYRDIKA